MTITIERMKELHEARKAVLDWKNVREAAYEEWLANIGTPILEAEAKAKVVAADLEAAIKAEAVAEYDGENKQSMPGIVIKDVTGYNYDLAEALAWAKQHAPAAVTEALNTRAWTDICKSQALRPRFVTVETKTTATIAQDLSKVLEG